MPELKYGLNLTKKPGLPPLGSRAPPRKTIFDEDDSPDEDSNGPAGPETILSFGGLKSASTTPASKKPSARIGASFPSGLPKRKAPQVSQFGDLSARHSSLKHTEEAQSLDPSVYDYDAVYDSLHAKPSKAKADDNGSGPKYMASLLAAAEVRKRDQLRAKEKTLQREREEEGEEFADKEKFVTGAYKAQQAELRRIEEEEQRREAAEMEKRRKQGGGMTGLYKDLLSREDERHEMAMKAAEEVVNDDVSVAKLADTADAKDDIAVAKDKGVIVNEDGQIVDKRQLLSAGLNITRKPKPEDNRARARFDDRESYASRSSGPRPNAKNEVRERQTRMLERQFEEASKRAADDEQTEKEALERASKRRTTEKDVSSAKERYLARKHAAEAEKKEGG